MPTPLPRSAAAAPPRHRLRSLREGHNRAQPGQRCGANACQVSGLFRSFEDSKHAYYLVYDFEIEVTDQFESTWETQG